MPVFVKYRVFPTLFRFLAMSLALVLLPFVPASNILFRVGFVIAERNLYLSSAGFIMVIALGIQIFCRTRRQVIATNFMHASVIFFIRVICSNIQVSLLAVHLFIHSGYFYSSR